MLTWLERYGAGWSSRYSNRDNKSKRHTLFTHRSSIHAMDPYKTYKRARNKSWSRHKVHHREERVLFFIRHLSNWSTLYRNALAAWAAKEDVFEKYMVVCYCSLLWTKLKQFIMRIQCKCDLDTQQLLTLIISIRNIELHPSRSALGWKRFLSNL